MDQKRLNPFFIRSFCESAKQIMACPTFCTSCIVTLLHRLRLREQEGLGATGRRRWWPVA